MTTDPVTLTFVKFTLPVTPSVPPIVVLLLTVSAFTVAFPLAPTVVNNAVLGAALPIGVACNPPIDCKLFCKTALPVKDKPDPLMLPVTPSVPPTVALLFTVKALAVKLLLNPPVVPCIAPLLVNALTVAVPNTLRVLPK